MHGNVDTTSDSMKTASNEIKKHENLGMRPGTECYFVQVWQS